MADAKGFRCNVQGNGEGGAVQTRPDPGRKTRRIVNLAMRKALNRPHEFKIHVRGAIDNPGLLDAMREVLPQTVACCGLPAAIDGFRAVRKALRDIETDQEK